MLTALLLTAPVFAQAGYGVRCADISCVGCESAPIQTLQHDTALAPVERYGPAMAFDGDPTTAWCEGEPGDGVGKGITIVLEEPRVVRAVLIHGGYFKTADLLVANGRAQTMSMATSRQGMSGHSWQTTLSMADPAVVPGEDPCAPGSPIQASEWFTAAQTGNGAYVFQGPGEDIQSIPVDVIELDLTSVYPGTRYQDTCISEIQIFTEASE